MISWAGIERPLFYLAMAAYLAAAFGAIGLLFKKQTLLNHTLKITLCAGLIFNGLAIAARTLQAGYFPFTGMYEFGIVFVFATVMLTVFLARRYECRSLYAFVLPIMVILAVTVDLSYHGIKPLVPALKSCWLVIHVAAAVVAYGLLAAACATAVMYLWKQRLAASGNERDLGPSLQGLDLMAGRLISWAIPFLTLLIITGAIWAEYAWGSYWQWDPKETWSLITWVIYVIYLHGRRVLGGRGEKSMWLIILGFIAVLITFAGVNLFQQGLHAYF